MAWISSINLSTRFWFFNFKSSEPLQVKSIITFKNKKKQTQFSNFVSSLAILSSKTKKNQEMVHKHNLLLASEHFSKELNIA